jgi:hypothetical protein
MLHEKLTKNELFIIQYIFFCKFEVIPILKFDLIRVSSKIVT